MESVEKLKKNDILAQSEVRRRQRGKSQSRSTRALARGNNSEDNLQFTLAANAFSNLSLLFADNGVNILVRVGKRIH